MRIPLDSFDLAAKAGNDSALVLVNRAKRHPQGSGHVFGRAALNGGLNTLYNFTDGVNGAYPYGGLVQGTNGNLIVQDERHFNTLGELDWSKDAMGRTTTYSNAYVGRFTVNTTTFPDGSQSMSILIGALKPSLRLATTLSSM